MEIERLINVLYRVAENQEKILIRLDAVLANGSGETNNSLNLDDLIDGHSVKSDLAIGKSTLYRLKNEKGLRTVRIGKRDYYSRAEIQKLINFYKK